MSEISIKHRDLEAGEIMSCLQIVEHLLAVRPNVWTYDDSGWSAMHCARAKVAQEPLIRYALGLESEGLQGSVQRLLRMRDKCHRTPIENAELDSRPYVEDQLTEAVERDGNIMFDFGNIDIESLHEERVEETELLEYLRLQMDSDDPDDSDPKNVALSDAADEYWEWWKHKRRSLQKQYRHMKRNINAQRKSNLPTESPGVPTVSPKNMNESESVTQTIDMPGGWRNSW